MSGPLRSWALAAALVLAPALAHADPISTTLALAPYIGTASAAWVASNMLTIAVVVGSAIVGNHQAKRAARKAREAYNASLEDRTVMIRTATGFHDLVLGRVRKSGKVYPVGQTGQYSEKMVLIVILAGHECDGIEQIWFDDEAVELDAEGNVTTAKWAKTETRSERRGVPETTLSITLDHDPVAGSVSVARSYDYKVSNVRVSGRRVSWTRSLDSPGYNANKTTSFTISYQRTIVTPKARVWWHLGTEAQAADARLMTLFPSMWTAAHRLAGLTYLVAELDYDPDIYGSQPPQISAVMRGAKVLDPRTGLTAWTDNPALLMSCVATHPLGGNLPSVAAGHDSIIVAANVCDIPATRTTTGQVVGSLTVTVPQYRAGYVHPGGTRAKDALDELAEAMCGKWAFVGNQLVVKAGGYTAPVITFTDSHFTDAGDIEVNTGLPRDQLFNVVTGTFADAANGYEQLDFPRVPSDPHITADGGELPLDVQFAAITDVAQVQQVAATMIRDHRKGLTLGASYSLAAWPLELFDTYAQDSTVYGWTGKVFEVMSRGFSLSGLVRLSAKETAAAIYTQRTQFDAVDVAPNTSLPNPRVVAVVQGLALLSDSTTMLQQSDGSIVPRIKASWQPVADEAVRAGGAVEVRYWPAHHTESAAAQTVEVAGSDVAAWLTGVQEGDLVIVKARARNGLPARSDWCVQTVVTVVGESAPASPVTGLARSVTDSAVNITWDQNPDVDRAQTELRVVAGLVATAAAWDTATPLWLGAATSHPWPRPAEGGYTVLAKHIDRRGNPSTTAAVLAVVVPAGGAVYWSEIVGAPASDNIVPNPEFAEIDGDIWALADMIDASESGVPGDAPAARVLRSTTRDYAAGLPSGGPRRYRVQPGEVLEFDVWVGLTTAILTHVGLISFAFGASPTLMDLEVYQGASMPGNFTGWRRATASVTVPPNQYWITPVCWIGQFGEGYTAYYAKPRIVRRSVGAASAAQAAAAAQQAANAAAADADTALLRLVAIDSDGILSRGEKPQRATDFDSLDGESAGIVATANSYGITTERDAYTSALSALSAYLIALSPAWNDTSSDTPIDQALDRAKWTTVYTTRQAVLNAISARAKVLADNAATAATVADGKATTANNLLADWSSDNTLSPTEKTQVKVEIDGITEEAASIDAQAASYGITTERSSYIDARNTLLSAVNPLLSSLTTSSTIDGTTFRGLFRAFYAARSVVLSKIAAVAGTLANWDTVAGRPFTYAQSSDPGAAAVGSTWKNTSTGKAYIRTAAGWEPYVGSGSVGTDELGAGSVTTKVTFQDAAGVIYSNAT